MKGYLKAEVAGAWQVKARKILLYCRAEHDQEERAEEEMQVLTKKFKRTKKMLKSR